MAYLYKRGKIWWAKFHHLGQTYRKSLESGNRQVARERARLIESSAKDRSFTIPAACTHTSLAVVLQDFCTHLRTTKTPKSAQTDIYYLRQAFGPACAAMQINARQPISEAERQRRLAATQARHLRPGPEHLRPRIIEDLTTSDVSRFLTNRLRKRHLAPKTGNRLREVLHRLCQWCISQRDTRFPGGTNPVSAVERFRENTPTIRFLTLPQIHEQLEVLKFNPILHAGVAILIYAGLRREELLWLTSADVDRDAAMIRVRAKTIGGQSWQPKTKRNRAVPISRALAAILDDYHRPAHSLWYCPSPQGCHWDPDNFSSSLRRINSCAGPTWSSLHFRHTFGSQLAMKGESLAKIAELMGNSPEICRRHYVVLLPERMTDVVEFDEPPCSGQPSIQLERVACHTSEAASA